MANTNKAKELIISIESRLSNYNNKPTLTENVAIRKVWKAIEAEAAAAHKEMFIEYRKLQTQDNTVTPTPTPVPTDALFFDSFDGTDGLITNETEYWNGGSKNANWEMTSGQLYRKTNKAYSGKDSSIFRLNTKRNDFGNVVISTKLMVVSLYSIASTPAVDWDGVHIWV